MGSELTPPSPPQAKQHPENRNNRGRIRQQQQRCQEESSDHGNFMVFPVAWRGCCRLLGRSSPCGTPPSSGPCHSAFLTHRKLTREHHPLVFQSFECFRNGGKHAMEKTSRAISHCFKSLEEFLFPRTPLYEEFARLSSNSPAVTERGSVFLVGCETTEEHYEKIRDALENMKLLHSEEGLATVGLEFRVLKCLEHRSIPKVSEESLVSDIGDRAELSRPILNSAKRSYSASSLPGLHSSVLSLSIRSNASDSEFSDFTPPCTGQNPLFCNSCSHRLFHVESGAMVTEENRKQFIADGDMYEEVARLCQEYAHDFMCKEGGLEWVTIEENCQDNQKEPIRALINSNHPLIHCGECCENDDLLVDRPTLLIATGGGKVRAGIFSRKHLMCGGIECSTAVPLIREALSRRLNVVIVDPNAHGDGLGYRTFQKTMDYMSDYFNPDQAGTVSAREFSESRELYILSHSASGGQLERYLLDNKRAYIPNIKAIAFTDSNHNLQWARRANNDDLCDMLESNRCIYFRYSNPEKDGKEWHMNSAGEDVQTDSFWKHRFGNIRTCWAGTNVHSLTNWYAHAKIWEHFDQFMSRKLRPQNGRCCEDMETGVISVDLYGSAT